MVLPVISPKLFKPLNELRTSTRISLLAGLSVFCVAMMMAAHFFGDSAVRQAFDKEDRQAELVTYAAMIQTAALALQASETNFLLNRDSAHAGQHEKAAARIVTLLDEAPVSSEAVTLESRVTDLRDHVREYTAQFRFIVRLFQQLDRDENKGIQGQFRRAVHTAEARISVLGLDRLLTKMLMLRRHEKDFLLREKPVYVERFNMHRAEFVELLTDTPVPASVKQDINAQMDAYADGFNTWVELSIALREETGRLETISAALAPAFTRFQEAVSANHAQVREALNSARSFTSEIFIITGIIVLGLALFFGTVIARSITRPLNAITESIKALAAGDLDQYIPGTANRDETGDIARALHVFKDHAIAHERLEAEKEESRIERKQAGEAERIRLAAHAGELADLAEQNRIARAEAESANQTKSEFLAAMSHELRTPLNAVIGFASILEQQKLGPLGNAKYHEYAKDIEESGQHLLQLINDILDLSKIEAGHESLDEADLTIADAVQPVMTMMRQRALKGGVELVNELPDDLPVLHADERKTKQILLNLMSNAVKFTKPGGQVTIGGSTEADGGLAIWVADTGIGIAPEDISKAFSQFGQIDSALNRNQEGTGLGLPLCKALVEQHDGSLDMQSEPDVGTTVTVRFPAARTVPPENKAHVA